MGAKGRGEMTKEEHEEVEKLKELSKQYKGARNYYADCKCKIAPHIDMKSADRTYVVGWLASQTDLLPRLTCSPRTGRLSSLFL
jgi:hypothetical protein